MKWIRENSFILALTLLALLILASPIIYFGVNKSFYLRLDTDIVYTTQALLFAKARIITFFDHPGTPTIVLFSYSFIPLRLIVKYLLHQNFIQWSFDNYAFLTFYLRIFQLIISGSTLFLFLKLMEKVGKSKLIILASFLVVFSSDVLSWSASMSSEPFSLLLTVIWLTLFVRFLKSKNYNLLIIMVFISGIAFAAKFTGAFLGITAIFLPLFIIEKRLGKRILMLEANMSIYFQSFMIGIWPIVTHLMIIINWFNALLKHPGKYGEGPTRVFDWATYSSSVITLFHSNPFVFIFIALALLFVLGVIVARKVNRNDWAVIFVFFGSFLGFLIFSKYPEIHYNFVNIFLLIFCAMYFLSKLGQRLIKIMIPVLMLLFIFTSYNYFIWSKGNILRDSNLSVNKVLEAWTPFWSSDIFRSQLDAVEKPEK